MTVRDIMDLKKLIYSAYVDYNLVPSVVSKLDSILDKDLLDMCLSVADISTKNRLIDTYTCMFLLDIYKGEKYSRTYNYSGDIKEYKTRHKVRVTSGARNRYFAESNAYRLAGGDKFYSAFDRSWIVSEKLSEGCFVPVMVEGTFTDMELYDTEDEYTISAMGLKYLMHINYGTDYENIGRYRDLIGNLFCPMDYKGLVSNKVAYFIAKWVNKYSMYIRPNESVLVVYRNGIVCLDGIMYDISFVVSDNNYNAYFYDAYGGIVTILKEMKSYPDVLIFVETGIAVYRMFGNNHREVCSIKADTRLCMKRRLLI